jgi:hypothetical protein
MVIRPGVHLERQRGKVSAPVGSLTPDERGGYPAPACRRAAGPAAVAADSREELPIRETGGTMVAFLIDESDRHCTPAGSAAVNLTVRYPVQEGGFLP